MARMTRKGTGRHGESTSLESSSRLSSQGDVVGRIIRRKKAKKQSAADHSDDDSSSLQLSESSSFDDDWVDTAAVKPDLEAYCRGSWWDVQVLKKRCDEYYVHYENFPDSQDEWVPLTHLRMRCRTFNVSDCCKVYHGMDVCVMVRHKHSEEKSAAWYDAKVNWINGRRPHTPRSCKCTFTVSLYSIPAILPRAINKRTLLPISVEPVKIKYLSIMRKPRSMVFEEVVLAALPNVINSPTIWATDGKRWNSSFDNCGPSSEPRPSFDEDLEDFGLFMKKFDPTPRSDEMNKDISESDEDVVILSVVPGFREPAFKPQPIDSDMHNAAAGEKDVMHDVAANAKDAMDDAAAYEDEAMYAVAACEDDAMDVVAICDDDGYTCVDRYPSDEEYEEMELNVERPEEVVKTTMRTESIGYFQEELEEVALSDLQSSEQETPRKPISSGPLLAEPATSISLGKPEEVVKTTSMIAESLGDTQAELDEVALFDLQPTEQETPQKPILSVPLPAELATSRSLERPEEVVKTAMRAESIGDFQEELDEVALSDLQPTEQETLWEPISSVPLPAEPATSFESDGDDFVQLLEEGLNAGGDEPEDDGFADYLELHIISNVGPKRAIADGANAPAAKRRRIDSRRPARSSPKPPLASVGDKEMVRPKVPSLQPKKTVKEPAGVSEMQQLFSAAFASSPVKGDSDGGAIAVEKSQYRSAEMLLDPNGPPVADILARNRVGLSTQPSLVKDKRPKKFLSAAALFPLKKVVKEITYAELFKTAEPMQCFIPSEQDTAEESGLLPSWNPFESMDTESLHRDVEDDQFADVWREMRFALDEGNDEVRDMEEDPVTKLQDTFCEDSEDGKHVVEFDQVVGEVCGVCGIVLLGIQDMWVYENARKINPTKEGDDDSDEDIHGNPNYGIAAWDFDDGKFLQQNNIEEGSNIELIPDLAKKMQKHQKLGFHFLWRNLAGQDHNGTPCFPRVEPGGCVLSHAPGTGKTFLIISFLASYMKKYPNCRPLIVAPKIMLQPWEKEFQKWNVDIPVLNFNRAMEQGRKFLQKHQQAGVVQYVKQKSIVNILRESMLWEWQQTPSVLVISYSMFNRSTLLSQSTPTIKSVLLDKPSIAVLDEGHNARNSSSQVGRQLMTVKTPLRILLSGTLFQNNFEELYTCLNLARSGFVHTFARIAGLKLNMQQEPEFRTDFEDEQWKEKAAKAAEAQAKKLFIEEIGNRIDKGQLAYSTPEYARGLALLRRLTTSFVHHYEGGVLRNLPPLRDFTVVLQPTVLQEKMIKSVTNRMREKTMLEQEGLLSFVCVHPSLLARHNVGKTFTDLLSPEEMEQAATDHPEAGVKTRFVINLLETLQDQGKEEKMLIFCQNLFPLALVEKMLFNKFGWMREQDILHIDGKVPADERQSIIGRFNDPQGKIRVLMLSTKACGEGVTLTGASRVVFMDVLWNPAVLRQAIHRAFRLGQTKVVHVYRLVLSDCLEEEKYKRMVLKDLKSQAIFRPEISDGKSDEADPSGPPQHDFWEVKEQASKDPVLNELERQDAARDEPAFKHVFRHGGLFDDEYDNDPEGKGANATEWLRNQSAEILDSSYDSDGALLLDCDTPESYDIEDGEMEVDSDADDDNEDVLLDSDVMGLLPL